MRFVIITGLSGAGKTNAVRSLEDIGYYCIDNMPPALISKFAEICYSSQGKLDKVALVCDVRGGELFNQLFNQLDELTENGYNYEVLFLDARDDVLIKRFKETRRKHPFSNEELLSEAIIHERAMLKAIKKKATHIIDTSDKLPQQLRSEIAGIFSPESKSGKLFINIVTFGFKYGIPLDSDLVFDVRFLPNPFYIPELKKLTGMNQEVSDYVMGYSQSQNFLAKLIDMITYLIPHYIDEGKAQLIVSIGCTGGRHRSVTIAEGLYAYLKENGHNVIISHRDYDKK
ncbi:MAG: RNase adapter RapZ [Clostridiales bacterium]|jgi:UPF0042 nucleotide-binding protein|nr:RNase adapter RapZ [Clostridiales bacterium]